MLNIVVQSLSRVQFLVTPWTAAHQAALSFTVSWSSLKVISLFGFFVRCYRKANMSGFFFFFLANPNFTCITTELRKEVCSEITVRPCKEPFGKSIITASNNSVHWAKPERIHVSFKLLDLSTVVSCDAHLPQADSRLTQAAHQMVLSPLS